MRRRTVLGVMATGLLAGSFPGALYASRTQSTDPLAEAEHHLSEARHRAGLPPLNRQGTLMDMGRNHAARMQASGHATHVDDAGNTPEVRAAQLGYEGRVLGEAVAETFGPPGETVQAWLDHAATRAVLMDPQAQELGLGMTRDGDDRMWWDLVTGIPKSPLP